MQRDLTRGPIARGLLLFALPLMAGNLLQQLYNVADTWVVGRFLGSDALAAVGSSYTLMTFLTSIFLGLCMGSGTAFSIQYGRRDMERFKRSLFVSLTPKGAQAAGEMAAVFQQVEGNAVRALSKEELEHLKILLDRLWKTM